MKLTSFTHSAMAAMDRHIFNLKYASKEMARNSRKSEKFHDVEKSKCKQAIRKGNLEIGRIHAENAIRQKNEAVIFLNMSARLDAVASRVQYAATIHRVSRSFEGITKAMDAALKAMNLEEISRLLDQFDKECVDLDLQAATMDLSMQQTGTSTAPHTEVEKFMLQVAEEAGLDVSLELPTARNTTPSNSETFDKDELEKRLATLRNG